MGLLDVPLRTALVHLRMQILQAQDLPALYEQSLTPILSVVIDPVVFDPPIAHPLSQKGKKIEREKETVCHTCQLSASRLEAV